jgi:uncharacterized protein (UPF0261 family)
VLGTLDTKATEVGYLVARIEASGYRCWVVDIGTAGQPGMAADTTRDQVREAGGEPEGDDKTALMELMSVGAGRILTRMITAGRLAGVVAMGGGQGSWMAARTMRELPLGLPKVLISTVALRASEYIGRSDLVFVPSVVDLAGLNRFVRQTLAQAASVLVGMIRADSGPGDDRRPLVGMTMFGVTTAGAEQVRRRLDAAGYEVAVFHANGIGGATMERLATAGAMVGVLDFTPTELADELAGGITTAGPHRLEAAGAAGLPQLLAPGALDVINFRGRDTVPARYAGRLFHQHTPMSTLMRTSAEESGTLGAIVAAKLNQARGPVRVLIPAGGFSQLDAPGGPFWDPEADEAFSATLRHDLNPAVPVDVLPHNINDREFADAAAETFLNLLRESATTPVRA